MSARSEAEAEELLVNIHKFLFPEKWPGQVVNPNQGTPTALFYLSRRIDEYVETHHEDKLVPYQGRQGFTINEQDN